MFIYELYTYNNNTYCYHYVYYYYYHYHRHCYVKIFFDGQNAYLKYKAYISVTDVERTY